MGKQDNRTPGGGATEEDEVFGKKLGTYLEHRWTQPPRIKLGDTLPVTLIELEIAPDGRVTGKRIVTPSGNAAMDASVQAMLDQLDRVPSPPRGKTVLQISMQTK
ncbi:MAG: TonB C-terminal domain-containing protein [Victivallaceae bacterium]|nr:TonB C-terminal domain-containing protein [Victivallaceae bacterium]